VIGPGEPHSFNIASPHWSQCWGERRVFVGDKPGCCCHGAWPSVLAYSGAFMLQWMLSTLEHWFVVHRVVSIWKGRVKCSY